MGLITTFLIAYVIVSIFRDEKKCREDNWESNQERKREIAEMNKRFPPKIILKEVKEYSDWTSLDD